MRLQLNIGGVNMQLKIMRWRKTPPTDICTDNWTTTECSLRSSYLHYDVNGEILTSGEVDDLIHTLARFLANELKQQYTIEFIEPDLEFVLHPAYNSMGQAGEIGMDLIIHFWDAGALSANQFSMSFSREEISALYKYLQTVTGELSLDDATIQQLVCTGILLPE